MKILIVNQPVDNRGDEAAHKSLMRGLNKSIPDAKLTVLFLGKSTDSVEQVKVSHSNNTYINYPIGRAHTPTMKWGLRLGIHRILSKIHPTHRKVISEINKSDIILCAPGGICMGGFQNWSHIYWLILAKLQNKPIVYYSRSFGPFPESTVWERIFKKFSIELLKGFEFLSIRDQKTMNFADKLGVPYIQSIDTAFLDNPLAAIPEYISKVIGDSPYIVFVPNELTWHHDFKDLSDAYILSIYENITEMLLRKYDSHKIIMLPQLFNSKNGDEKYFRTLASKIGSDRIFVVPETMNSDIQQVLISNAALMVGARYHSVVFAINNKTPFVALSYEHKITGLLNLLGKSKQMVDISNLAKSPISPDNLTSHIRNVIDFSLRDDESKQMARSIAENCLIRLVKFINDRDH